MHFLHLLRSAKYAHLTSPAGIIILIKIGTKRLPRTRISCWTIPAGPERDRQGGYNDVTQRLPSRCGNGKKLDCELILFFSEQAQHVKRGFYCTIPKTPAEEITRNQFGEEQMALDKYADEVFISGLKKTRLVRYIATEEQDQIIEVHNPKNNFGVVIDPLDGSSLIDVNLCVGSIIGIYPGHILEKGITMVAALYILYGPLTTLTFTTGQGVHEFVMNDAGEFVLRHKDLEFRTGKSMHPVPCARIISRPMPGGSMPWRLPVQVRFSGCFVGDIHQILHKGGVFSYPGFKGKEKGKLRLLYEANPMGMIIYQAGGAVSTAGLISSPSNRRRSARQPRFTSVAGKRSRSLKR